MGFPLPTVFEIFSNDHAVPVITKPGALDILCGQDKTFAQHAGNEMYRALIRRQSASYAKATTKQAKMKVTKAIVTTMKQQYGSRFLKRCKSKAKSNHNHKEVWEEIADAAARDKTSHALRFCAEKESQQQQQASVVITDDHPIFVRQAEILLQQPRIQPTTPPAPVTSIAITHATTQIQTLNTVLMVDDMQIDTPDNFATSHQNSVKETFDTLRSEDLHAILDEPLHENEWDDVMTLAE